MKKTLFLLSLTVCTTACLAQDRQDQRERPRQPPQEAIDACTDQEESAEVTFSGRRGETLSATCQRIDGQLVAVPEDHNKKQRR
jgi:hypothetical protein